eukprot:GHVP01053693.1.p1 GENE.GHVP01053693.1~~GHVP01053693.1.p1  ORF type:complete len:200 (+),score=25.82 GHVP01053693.1:571-1170(+)
MDIEKIMEEYDETPESDINPLTGLLEKPTSIAPSATIGQTFQKIWMPCVAAFLCLTTCLSVFPGPILATVGPEHRKLAVGTFLIFDLIGRYIADEGFVIPKVMNLRFVFIRLLVWPPLAMLLITTPSLRIYYVPFVFAALTGILQGLQCSSAVIAAQQEGKLIPKHASNVLTVFIVAGVFAGANLASVLYNVGFYPAFK